MIFFYTLSTVCLLSCTLLVISRNPVYSLLNLVVFFICGSLHLLYLGVDFLAYVFVIVYVGALAVLFLFVVIILDIKLTKLKNTKQEIPIVFLSSILCFFYLDYGHQEYLMQEAVIPKFSHYYDNMSILKTLGYVLYTQYVIHFVLCGLVLLVAIIGAIVLTSKGRYQKTKAKEKHFKQCERFHSLGKIRNSTYVKNSVKLSEIFLGVHSVDYTNIYIFFIIHLIFLFCLLIFDYVRIMHKNSILNISKEEKEKATRSFFRIENILNFVFFFILWFGFRYILEFLFF